MLTSPTETESTNLPKILILGATGPTGRHIVRQAVARGYDVTVFVRSPEKAADLTGARIVEGDARDEKALRQAVKGRNAVISALGTPASPFREVTLLSSATRTLIDAMMAERVARLVAITGIGAGDSVGHGGFLFDASCSVGSRTRSSASAGMYCPAELTCSSALQRRNCLLR